MDHTTLNLTSHATASESPLDGPRESSLGPRDFPSRLQELQEDVGSADAQALPRFPLHPQGDFPIDPVLLATPIVPSAHGNGDYSSDDVHPTSLSDEGASGTSPISATRRASRQRPSNIRPMFGFVEGTGRGNIPLRMLS